MVPDSLVKLPCWLETPAEAPGVDEVPIGVMRKWSAMASRSCLGRRSDVRWFPENPAAFELTHLGSPSVVGRVISYIRPAAPFVGEVALDGVLSLSSQVVSPVPQSLCFSTSSDMAACAHVLNHQLADGDRLYPGPGCDPISWAWSVNHYSTV